MHKVFLMPEGIGRFRRMWWSVVLSSVEFFVAFLALVSGGPILLDPTSLAPSTILGQMPLWMVYVWAGGLVLGGLFSLIGILTSSYRVERVGAMFLAMTAAVYCFALLPFLPTSWVAFSTYVIFTMTMLARYWALGKVIKVMARVREEVN